MSLPHCFRSIPALAALAALSAVVASGCTSKDSADSVPTLPDQDTGTPDSDTGPFELPIDSASDSGYDSTPPHWLHLYQEGTWDLSPAGGPYNAVSGTFSVIELVDFELPSDTAPPDSGVPWDTGEDSPLWCEVTYSLSGTVSEDNCSGCGFSMDVVMAPVDGDAGMCRSQYLPNEDEPRTYGFNGGDQMIHFQVGAGIWVPWWNAVQTGDHIDYEWEGTLGISIEEEEDE